MEHPLDAGQRAFDPGHQGPGHASDHDWDYGDRMPGFSEDAPGGYGDGPGGYGDESDGYGDTPGDPGDTRGG